MLSKFLQFLLSFLFRLSCIDIFCVSQDFLLSFFYLTRKSCNVQNAADCVDVGQAYVVKACVFFGDVAQFKNVTDFFVVVLQGY